MENTFGKYLSTKRLYKHISVRAFAEKVGISATYLSKIENGLKPAPANEILVKMADKLSLSNLEKEAFYDLAAKTKGDTFLAQDLIKYINENEIIHITLRLSKRCNVSAEDWRQIYKLYAEKYIGNL